MRASRWVLGAGALLVGLVLVSSPRLRAREGSEGLRYMPSYAAAWAEARERGALIFATFHKDN